MINKKDKVVLITGANRGLGLSISKRLSEKGYSVINGIRGIDNKIENAVYIEMIDIDGIKQTVNKIFEKYSHIDILINNAGVYIDDPRKGFGNLLRLNQDILEYTLKVNYIGLFTLINLIVPKMLEQGYGRIVNISSGMGRLYEFDEYSYAYRASKLLMNTLSISYGKMFEELEKDIAITSVCPGWLKTDMGTSQGVLDPEFVAANIVKILDT